MGFTRGSATSKVKGALWSMCEIEQKACTKIGCISYFVLTRNG